MPPSNYLQSDFDERPIRLELQHVKLPWLELDISSSVAELIAVTIVYSTLNSSLMRQFLPSSVQEPVFFLAMEFRQVDDNEMACAFIVQTPCDQIEVALIIIISSCCLAKSVARTCAGIGSRQGRQAEPRGTANAWCVRNRYPLTLSLMYPLL